MFILKQNSLWSACMTLIHMEDVFVLEINGSLLMVLADASVQELLDADSRQAFRRHTNNCGRYRRRFGRHSIWVHLGRHGQNRSF